MPDQWSKQPSKGVTFVRIDNACASELREYVQTLVPDLAEIAKTPDEKRPSVRKCWDDPMPLLFFAIRMLGMGVGTCPSLSQRIVDRCTSNMVDLGTAWAGVEPRHVEALTRGIDNAIHLIREEPEVSKKDVVFARRCRWMASCAIGGLDCLISRYGGCCEGDRWRGGAADEDQLSPSHLRKHDDSGLGVGRGSDGVMELIRCCSPMLPALLMVPSVLQYRELSSCFLLACWCGDLDLKAMLCHTGDDAICMSVPAHPSDSLCPSSSTSQGPHRLQGILQQVCAGSGEEV